jgi:hypothetical protein
MIRPLLVEWNLASARASSRVWFYRLDGASQLRIDFLQGPECLLFDKTSDTKELINFRGDNLGRFVVGSICILVF